MEARGGTGKGGSVAAGDGVTVGHVPFDGAAVVVMDDVGGADGGSDVGDVAVVR
jgi:hypothetical protein